MTNYFYVRNEKNIPVGCVGWQAVNGNVNFAVSTCAPSDKFEKSFAKHIVDERIRLGKSTTVKTNVSGNGRTMRVIMTHISLSPKSFPKRTVLAARQWLERTPNWSESCNSI